LVVLFVYPVREIILFGSSFKFLGKGLSYLFSAKLKTGAEQEEEEEEEEENVEENEDGTIEEENLRQRAERDIPIWSPF
jgi:hypothetical protein